LDAVKSISTREPISVEPRGVCALFGAPHPQVHFRMFGPKRNPDFCVTCLRGEYYAETSVVGRKLTRQAATLLKFARSTANSDLAAVLVEKAADLKSQVDETIPPPDPSPLAPDVERPA
jgi:hypothetical protein